MNMFCSNLTHTLVTSVAEPVHFWPAPGFFWPALAPAPALVKKYALKKLKKMNNSTSCSRKNTFLRISFLFVHVRMQEQNRVQSVWNKNTVNFKKVKLYLQYQYLQVVSSVNFWGTFLKFNFSSMVEPEPVLRTGSGRLRLRNTALSLLHLSFAVESRKL